MNFQTTLVLLAVFLHALLLTLLFLRGAARRLPAFTTLIAFYLLRSLLLYGLFGHMDDDAYALFFNALDLLDLFLQVLVMWELLRKTSTISSTLHRAALFAGLLLLSAAASWGISMAIPATPHLRLDRGLLLTSALMLLTALTSIKNAPTLARRVLFGFGALGFANILCQVERTLAAFHREPLPFRRWSYIEAVAYLAIVLFWIVDLISERRRTAHCARDSGARNTIERLS